MAPCFLPLQYVIAALAVWLNRQQQEVIDYLKEENRLLKEKPGGRKLRFTDAERRRLAARAKALGRKILAQLDTLVTPDTLLRWHRELVAQKWNHVAKRRAGFNRLILFGEASLRRALREFTAHYHYERNHQGINNELVAANGARFSVSGAVTQRERVGGMLNFYYRKAA